MSFQLWEACIRMRSAHAVYIYDNSMVQWALDVTHLVRPEGCFK